MKDTTVYGVNVLQHPVKQLAVDVPSSDTEERASFAESGELGAYLSGLAREQIEIDRQEAERLASVRAMQDRD